MVSSVQECCPLRALKNLDGIDDPLIGSRIRKQALERTSRSGSIALYVLIAGKLSAIIVYVVGFPLHHPASYLLPFFAIFTFFLIADRLFRAPSPARLKEVLAEEGRCIQCGYLLEDDLRGQSCPECGNLQGKRCQDVRDLI